VLIIGGGPGGLEAARVAASRGCDVTLWEQRNQLGGKLPLAGAPEFKRDIRPLTTYLTRQADKLGVRVELNKTVTPELVRKHKPDVVILATGSRFKMPPLPGVERQHVLSTVELFEGTKPVGPRVVVVGGGLCGCEAAAYLADQGKQVTIIEMMAQLAEGKTINNVLAIGALLAQKNVEVMTETKLIEIASDGVVVERHGQRQKLVADSVVIATGFTPDLSLRDALEEGVEEVVAVGDCAKPRTILDAIWEGFHAARVIE
jgi:NADPH-dependent 2,4-dienoyl-CoA reductase/sulfur reductase-like enzyme